LPDECLRLLSATKMKQRKKDLMGGSKLFKENRTFRRWHPDRQTREEKETVSNADGGGGER